LFDPLLFFNVFGNASSDPKDNFVNMDVPAA